MIGFTDRHEGGLPPAAGGVSLTARASGMNSNVHQPRSVRWRSLAACSTSLILATLVGCGDGKAAPLKVYPATGTVRFQGQATPGAIITLFPKDKSLPEDLRPNAIADETGHFDLGTYSDADGAPEGDYDVVVTWSPLIQSGGSAFPGPNVLPARYSKPETCQLTVHINDDDTELKPLDLTP